MAVVLTLSFTVEVYLSEVYDGAFKEYLVLYPNVWLTLAGVHTDDVSFLILPHFVENISSTFTRIDELRKPSHGTRIRQRIHAKEFHIDLFQCIHEYLSHRIHLRFSAHGKALIKSAVRETPPPTIEPFLRIS